MQERCQSPLNPECGSRDIVVYIMFGGKRLPICRKCWEMLADSNLEWGEKKMSVRTRHRRVEEAKRKLMEKAIEEAKAEAVEKIMRRAKSRKRL